jgi:16S rRNA (guanine1516-N2)-methyltransferase
MPPSPARQPARDTAVTWSGDESQRARAGELAGELALPVVRPENADFGLLLVCAPGHLELRDCRHPRVAPVHVDFSHLDLRRYGHNLSRRQPLARAIGKKTKTVVDATAGYCQDALLLALMGFHVIAIERSPVVAALARDALQRFAARAATKPVHRLQIVMGDALALLPAMATRPETIYLDPMFPAKRKKSAAVKKEMRLLRELVGDDPDALALLDVSRRVALERVVVKRPDDAPPLAPGPSMSIAGKLVRYDIYLARKQTS